MPEEITTTVEVWKPIPGWEGMYDVSNLGRVKSLARPYGGDQFLRERIRKTHPNPKGYYAIKLCRNNKISSMLLHRAVLAAFIGPPPRQMQGCHNDGNKANNLLNNLRYDTAKANAADRKRHWGRYFLKKNSARRPRSV